MTVLVANDDITVIGGPTSINVNMDIGATGKRGSQIFISLGNPNDVEIGQTIEVFDLCINTLKSDSEYLSLYQYQNRGAVNQWVRLFELIPDSFSQNSEKSFVDGLSEINVPVSSITSTENLTALNFNVQCSVIGENPVSTSISISEIDIIDDIQVLPISLKCVEFVDNAWSLINGSRMIHLLITVV